MTPIAILGGLWVVFIVVWFISALFAKRTLHQSLAPWLFRIIVSIALLVLLSWRGGPAPAVVALWQPWASAGVQYLGVVLAALGIALAIWARLYLGRNWGMPQSVKENPELITTGPYHYIRHPIYSGMLLAFIGSILTSGLGWIIVFVVGGSYFIWSSKNEERLMEKTFPETYPAYKARTYALIPFIY